VLFPFQSVLSAITIGILADTNVDFHQKIYFGVLWCVQSVTPLVKVF